MKALKVILIVSGILLIVLNVMGTMNGMPDTGTTDIVLSIAYYIGFFLPTIIGIICLFTAWLVHKKILRRKEQEIADSFLNDTEEKPAR
jgi:hypothetical protein